LPLALAAASTLLQVEALVSENANCTMLNVSGHTPLDLACQGGHAQVTPHTVCEWVQFTYFTPFTNISCRW